MKKDKLNKFSSFEESESNESDSSNSFNKLNDNGNKTSFKYKNKKGNKFKKKNKFNGKRMNSGNSSKLIDRNDSLLLPSSALFIDENKLINSHTVLKVAFRVNDNKCLDSILLDGIYTQHVTRFIADRGLQNLELDVPSIVEGIKLIRNASFEAYSCLLSFSRKYSVGKLVDYRGSNKFGRSFARDVVHNRRNVPTIIDCALPQSSNFTEFDYLDLKISKAVWAQQYQSRFYNFYLTKEGVDYCHDLFENYIRVKNENLSTIYLDCFPESAIGRYLERIKELENYLISEVYSKFPYIRSIMTSFNYLNLKDYAYTIMNDVSRTTLREKIDNSNLSNSTYNWPFTWSIFYNLRKDSTKTIEWNDSPNYSPEPEPRGLFNKIIDGVFKSPETMGKIFTLNASNVLLVELNRTKSQLGPLLTLQGENCYNRITDIFNTWKDDQDYKNYQTRLKPIFANDSRCQAYFNDRMRDAYKRLNDVLNDIINADTLNTGGLERLAASNAKTRTPGSGDLLTNALSSQAALAVTDSPLGEIVKILPTVVKYANPTLFIAGHVAKFFRVRWQERFSQSPGTKGAGETFFKGAKNAVPLQQNDESLDDYKKRLTETYDFTPDNLGTMESETYSLRYLRDTDVFSIKQGLQKFDTNVLLNEFCSMDRFRMLRPTSHAMTSYYHTTNDTTLVNRQVAVVGIWNKDKNLWPGTLLEGSEFAKIMNDNTSLNIENMFRGEYIFSNASLPPSVLLNLSQIEGRIYDNFQLWATTPPTGTTNFDKECIKEWNDHFEDINYTRADSGRGIMREYFITNYVNDDGKCHRMYEDSVFNETMRNWNDLLLNLPTSTGEIPGNAGADDVFKAAMNTGFLACCDAPFDNTKLECIEDLNTLRIRENDYYREIAKIAVFHRSIANDLVKGLKEGGSIGVSIM